MSAGAVMLLGGAGFVGRALAVRLEQQGVSYYMVGRDNQEQLGTLLPQCGTVVHLASSTTPGSSATQPELELPNLALTLQLLKQLQSRPPAHLIYFSSGGTVYGNPAHLPVSEDASLSPLSYHGAGKAAQEQLILAARAHGHAVTIVRPSNAYGAGQSLRGGFGLIRTLLEHARLQSTLQIWGDGEHLRDYIYIDDVIEATWRLIERPGDNRTYNLGSGRGYSIRQVLARVEEVCGLTIPASYSAARGVDVRHIVLDCTRLQAATGWSPAVDLDEGIQRTWLWLRQNQA